MKLKNISVFGLEESKVGASFPMSTDESTLKVPEMINKLGSVRSGTGHDCFLKGIRVILDVEATQFEWMQIERYVFFDIISSQSKMHKLTVMNLEDQLDEHVNAFARLGIEQALKEFKLDNNYHKLMCNVPSGLYLSARCSTNYMQLKTMYNQRKNHRLIGWKHFCMTCDSLPEFNALTGCKL